jgi:hypothetical protein
MAAICTLRLFDSTATRDQTASMIAFLGTNALGRSSNSARTSRAREPSQLVPTTHGRPVAARP